MGHTLVVTGASGYVGQMLVPRLEAQGHHLILAGRNAEALSARFPHHVCTDYAGLSERSEPVRAILHLAARNNSQGGSLDDFRDANVGLVRDLLQIAASIGVQDFLFFSTLHTSGRGSETPYGATKAEAEALLRSPAADGLAVHILRLAAVHGDGPYRGNLAVLNPFPRPLRKIGFSVLSRLRPTTHIDRLHAAVEDILNGQAPGDHSITD